jgi:hypothetical protein
MINFEPNSGSLEINEARRSHKRTRETGRTEPVRLRGREVPPSAKRIIHSLRDMGYSFEQAVADVVDNSVRAGATQITIDAQFDGDNSWVRIADNGTGMSEDEICEALRYGSQREYDEDDLGKFGLGLKTASLSQCRRLSVASRNEPRRGDCHAYAWDLTHISNTDRWEVLPITRGSMLKMLSEPLEKSTGTVVLWENLDRVLGYKKPYGEAARKRISNDCRRLEQHLGMVFHRFISGEVKDRQFSITINGNTVVPWDPFCRSESKTIELNPIRLSVDEDGIKGSVILHPYFLPRRDDFSSQEAFARAGCGRWNQMQGFYIYRANRLIQAGGWSNLRARDEHTKGARVAVSFLPAVDEAFKINVAKMRAQLPSSIREKVDGLLGPYLERARAVYAGRDSATNAGGTGTGSGTGTGAGGGAGGVIGGGTGGRGRRTGTDGKTKLLTREQWAREMMLVARLKERPVVRAVLKRMKARGK